MSYVSCWSQERPVAEEPCPDFDGDEEVPAELGDPRGVEGAARKPPLCLERS